MEREKIMRLVDHTLLTPTATWEEIKQLCDDAMEYHTASVCIPPSFVRQVKNYVKNQMKVCTVIGFPNGYQTTAVKVFEAKDAIANGADEIDMVINLGYVKDGFYHLVREEILKIRAACQERVLKVIVETCLLTEEEKVRLCKTVTEAGADFIKTSTGFSSGGATFDDVSLFDKNIGPNVRIKAAGGISSFEDAEHFIRLGATRLGTSRMIKLAREEQVEGY